MHNTSKITREEAVAYIETWLIAPGEYAEILPYLSVLRGSRDYTEQKRAVSIFTGRSEMDIENDVHEHLSGSARRAAQRPVEVIRTHTHQQGLRVHQSVDGVTITAEPYETPYYEQDLGPGAVHHAHHRPKRPYQHGNGPMLHVQQCLNCGDSMPVYQGRTKMKEGGCLLMVLIAFFFFPLFWIPLVIFRERKAEVHCETCRSRYHLP